jgi:hypothetical protein
LPANSANPGQAPKCHEAEIFASDPPPPAIERQVEQLGVSPKQKERARQSFMKSAQYAGFIDASTEAALLFLNPNPFAA